jgi:hypothetical protein
MRERISLETVSDFTINIRKAFYGPGRRWKDNISMDLREIGWEGVDWMHLEQLGTSGGFL